MAYKSEILGVITIFLLGLIAGILYFRSPVTTNTEFLEGADMARLQRILCIADVHVTSDDFLEPYDSNLSEFERNQREERLREKSKVCLNQFQVN